MRRTRLAGALALALLADTSLVAAPAGSADEDPDPLGPAAGGRLIWDGSDELELLGDMWADLAFMPRGRGHALGWIDARTTIVRSTSDLTFELRDIDYDLGAAWVTTADRAWLGRIAAVAGQRGKQRIDADGQPFVRYVGIEIGSTRSRRPFGAGPAAASGPRWAWTFTLAPVVDEREIEANALLRGGLALRAGARRRFGFEADFDGLLTDDGLRADLAVGPAIELPLGSTRAASLFTHYQWSRNPLGIGHSALLVGFEYAGRTDGRSTVAAPRIDGLLGVAGAEDGRTYARFGLRVVSPSFASELRLAFDVDANLLTAEETGDLYYHYTLGLEKPLADYGAGVYFHHRSNHRFAEPNQRVTSLNIAELGIESSGWRNPCLAEASPRTLEAGLRLGWLIDSSFGEDPRWHVRGGTRWTATAVGARLRPLVEIEAELGDVSRARVAVGARVGRCWSASLEYQEDDQWFADDRELWMLAIRHGF